LTCFSRTIEIYCDLLATTNAQIAIVLLGR